MKKTKLRLIKNCVLSGMLFFPGILNSAEGASCCAVGSEPAAISCDTRADDKAEAVKYLLVWDNEGGFMTFALEERPRIVSDYELQEIKCITTKQEVSFTMSEVHKYTLHANPDELMSVENVIDDEGSFRRDVDSFGFDNFKPGSKVSVYTINGMLVHSYDIDNDGRLTIPTAGWAAGVYIIKTASVTYKVIKK